MYEHAIETLTAAGYKHYEISNFAKPGRECQHNLVYWRNGNYLGVGAGAHSHWNGQRWANPNCIETYIGGAARNVERITTTYSSRATDQRETLFLGLRLLDGLTKAQFSGFEKEAQELIKDGLLEDAGNNYRLTRKGLYLGNEVFARFV
jgi:oxygen-independent coproporphyrinogen-3 oxidase